MVISHNPRQEQWLYSKIGNLLIQDKVPAYDKSITNPDLSKKDFLRLSDCPEIICLSGAEAEQQGLFPRHLPHAPYEQSYHPRQQQSLPDIVIYVPDNLSIAGDILLEKDDFKAFETAGIDFYHSAIIMGKQSRACFFVDLETDSVKNSWSMTHYLHPESTLYYTQYHAPQAVMNLWHYQGFLQKNAALYYAIYGHNVQASRQESHIFLQESGANAHLNQVILGQHHNIVEHIACMHHLAPHTESAQEFYSLADDNAHIHIQAKTFVAQIAQKTNSSQLLKSILKSPKAAIFAKPELEIYADDVKCSHGATVGQLDEQAINYLRARGIPRDIAEKLLLQAFIENALAIIPSQTINQMILEEFQKI